MQAQGIVEPSGSTVRELQLILNWMKVWFLENAHLKTENVENIPQKYMHTHTHTQNVRLFCLKVNNRIISIIYK